MVTIVDDYTTHYYENPSVRPSSGLLPDMTTWEDMELWQYDLGSDPFLTYGDFGFATGDGYFQTIRLPANTSPFDHHLGTFVVDPTGPVKVRFDFTTLWTDSSGGTGTLPNIHYCWLEDLGGNVLSGTQSFLIDPNFNQPFPASASGSITALGSGQCAFSTAITRSAVVDCCANVYVEWELDASYRDSDLRIGIAGIVPGPPFDASDFAFYLGGVPAQRFTEYLRPALVGETECESRTDLVVGTAPDISWTSFGDPSNYGEWEDGEYFPNTTKHNRYPYFSNGDPPNNTETEAPFTLWNGASPFFGIAGAGQLGTVFWSLEMPEILEGQIFKVDMEWTPNNIVAHGEYRYPYIVVMSVDVTGNMVPIIELANESAASSVTGPIYEAAGSDGVLAWSKPGLYYDGAGAFVLDSCYAGHIRRTEFMTPQTWTGEVRWENFGLWDSDLDAFHDNGTTRASSWGVQPTAAPYGVPTHFLVGVMGAQFWTCNSLTWSVCPLDTILRQFPRDDDLGMPYSGKGRMWAPGSNNMPTSRQRSQRQGRHGGTYL
jgi:hypothetical protein